MGPYLLFLPFLCFSLSLPGAIICHCLGLEMCPNFMLQCPWPLISFLSVACTLNFLSFFLFSSFLLKKMETKYMNIKLTILKCTRPWHLGETQGWATVTNYPSAGSFRHTKKPCTCELSLPPPSFSLWQPVICFLSLWVSLFWTFHINGIVHQVVFH